MTELLKQAYAFDLNNAIRTTRRPGGSPKAFTGETGRPMIVPQAVDVPAGAHVDNASPVMEPVKVYQDDRVTVTATLVDHPPVFPAFAYRFDTPHGSVVFSGDTTSCRNLVDLATGADVLVNEVVAVDEALAMYGEPTSPPPTAASSSPATRPWSAMARRAKTGTCPASARWPPPQASRRWSSPTCTRPTAESARNASTPARAASSTAPSSSEMTCRVTTSGRWRRAGRPGRTRRSDSASDNLDATSDGGRLYHAVGFAPNSWGTRLARR